MCLLIVASRVDAEAPLIVGANRDERMDRAAVPLMVLQAAGPRILGGRDELAGGTWLAVNDEGVFAALTNQPSPDGRDPAKRSRGELPMALAAHRSAAAAVDDFIGRFRPTDYNRAWLMVGDRSSLHYIDMTGEGEAGTAELGPGYHVLGNVALGAPSVKVDHVRQLLEHRLADGDDVRAAIRAVLADHTIPPGAEQELEAAGVQTKPLPLQVAAACVHGESYGTRSAALVELPADPAAPPRFCVAPGPSCVTPFTDAGPLWKG